MRALTLSIALALFCCVSSRAQAPASRPVAPPAERDRFLNAEVIQRLRDALTLSDAQARALNSMLEGYLAEGRTIADASRDAQRALGTDRINDAIHRGDREGHLALLEEMTEPIRAIDARYARATDELLRRTISEMATTIGLDDAATQTFWRIVRREYLFTGNVMTDFRRRVDLAMLVAEASADGGELAALARADASDDLRPMHDALKVCLTQYEDHLQADAEQRLRERLQPVKGPAYLHFTKDDFEAWKEHSKQQALEWRQRHEFTLATHRQIGDIILSTGDVAGKRRWDDRLYHEMCHDVFGEFFPDHLRSWVAKHATTDEAHLTKVDAVVERYRRKKGELQREVARAGLAAWAEGDHGVSETAASKRYAKALIDLHRLGIEAIRDAAKSLPPDERDKMMRRLAISGGIDTGPFIPMFLPTATGLTAEFEAIDKAFR